MGKYDYIRELTGEENYYQWSRQMTLALQVELLWSHCSHGTDPLDPINFASTKPVPADASTLTDDERDRILSWSAKDAQAKALIERKVSRNVADLLDTTHTARQQWDFLARHYSRNDLLSQYELRSRIRTEKLKDVEDATRYVAVFENAHQRFIEMGVTYTTEASIFDLLQGLPKGIEWEIFRELTLEKLSLSNAATTATTGSTTSPTAFTFNDAAKLLTEKANAIVRRRKLPGPNSEYTNAMADRNKGRRSARRSAP